VQRALVAPVEDPDEIMDRVGRRMAELRAEAGLTQAEVARRMDTAVNNYQRIEHGLQNVTLRTMVKIAGVLGVATAVLLEAPSTGKKSGRRGRPRSR
jgi:transcriptional regulator with XRE-family HTH domain